MNGQVTTLEASPTKIAMAKENFSRAGLEGWIRVLEGAECLDFIFLDSERTEYLGWWPDLRRILRSGGLLVVDNAVSHAGEMETFVQAIEGTPGFVTSLVPVGKGEFLGLKP